MQVLCDIIALVAVAGCGGAQSTPAGDRSSGSSTAAGRDESEVGLVDHHTHIFSEASRRWLAQAAGRGSLPPLAGPQLMAELDAARVERAAVFSVAYFFSQVGEDDPGRVQEENDWVATQAERHGERLVAFCSMNPLVDHALAELARCARSGRFAGIKLHLANSKVDLRDGGHVRRLADLFAAASAWQLAIVVHLRTERSDFGRKDVELFVTQVLPRAAGVPVQIAHMAGWGGYDPTTDEALSVFREALRTDALARSELYFDLSAVVRSVTRAEPDERHRWWPTARYARLVEQMRGLGLHRVLFGSDWPEWTPAQYVAQVRETLPLTPGEVSQILANRAPWLDPTR